MNKIDEKKYVVLDVETNGLSSIRDDLLSISLYKPDDKKMYNRFLPLELNDWVETTYINGITEEMLEGKLPLTQNEFDSIVFNFELDKRIILTYGSIDEKFVKNYLKRKKIKGFEKLTFYNFKHDIISSRFSEGNITKDNLCRICGIENVQKVHSGINDCILEWQLFHKMNGNKLLVINNRVYEFSKDYIIPVSYLTTYPNFKYCIDNFPKINCKIEELKKIRIDSTKIKKFENNITGISIEHLINSLLNVKDMNEETLLFQIKNKKNLKELGKLPSLIHEIPISFNSDGTLRAINIQDEKRIKEINKVTELIKENIKPLIKYIKQDIFDNEEIMSQELVINKEDNILAKCDLSTKNAVLEIKTYIPDMEKIKYQLYYEACGRDIYILQTEWNSKLKKGLIFTVYKVIFQEKDYNFSSITNMNKVKSNIEESRKYKEKIISRKVRNYFNYENGNRWSLGWLKFKAEDEFNYEYINKYIHTNNVSIIELAKKIDVAENSVRNWLVGKSRPYVWNAFAICVWLDIDEKLVILKRKK